MHSETFPLSGVSYLEPEKELEKLLTEKANRGIEFSKLQVGESYQVKSKL